MKNAISTATERLQALWHAQPRPGSDWLFDLQRQAIDQFGRTGFPTARLENWKYTDTSKLAQLYPDWLNHKAAETGQVAREQLDIRDALHLIFIDGVFQPACSSQDLPEYLLVGNLAQLAQSHRETIESRFNQLSRVADSALAAVNTAFSAHCTALILPADTTLTRPVYIEYWSSNTATSSHPRLLVDLGNNSKATLIEHYSGSTATLINAVAELTIGQGAHLSYYKLHETHSETLHTAVQQLRLESHATVKSMTIDRGSSMSRNELYACLAGPGASIEAQGLLLGDGSRQVESRITIEHSAPHTTSRSRYRAILADKSRGIFNGRILVQQQAQKTNAELTNRNLLLNRGAEINTKPELEIYADDVKCAHGSTTGQIDPTALFYLLSRGIDEQAARNILVTAFASELLTGIEIPAIAERARQALISLRFN